MKFLLLWERYILSKLCKCFLFFLFCFLFLYCLMDFSTHVQDFSIAGDLSWTKIGAYYVHQCIKRSSLLLPLTLLIATIKVLTTLNEQRELVAFRASGMKIATLMRPFLLLGALASLLCYANEEFFAPQSLQYLDQVRSRTTNALPKAKGGKQFSLVYLSDSSKLIYQKLEKKNQKLFDVYWIRSFDDIWKMKYLSADPSHPIGEYVDHIIRSPDGLLQKKESFITCHLPQLQWEKNQLNTKQSQTKYQKISTLIQRASEEKKQSSFHLDGEIRTYLWYKLLMPLLPLLTVVGVIPSCVRYTRSLPLFLLYSNGIFAFIVFFTFIDAMLIVSENQVLSPITAIVTPFILMSMICGYRFYQIDKRK